MNFTKVISSVIENGQRFVKFLRMGNSDIQSSIQAAPYGIDSAPIENLVAVYGKTEEKGKTVIIGYLNKNAIAEPGEFRAYSTDAKGKVKFAMHFKKDGTAEFGGTADFMVRFNKLESGFNTLKADHNLFLVHVHGVAGTPPVPPAPPSVASIAAAKIGEVTTS